MSTIVDSDARCPHDDGFVHRFYFGCVPLDFSDHTGRSKRYRQRELAGRWFWNGGCDAHHRRGEHAAAVDAGEVTYFRNPDIPPRPAADLPPALPEETPQ